MAKKRVAKAAKKTTQSKTNPIENESWLDEINKINEGVGYAMAAHSTHTTGITSKSAMSLAQGAKSRHAEIIAECVHIYRTTGMVKNIIDLMSDFTTEGIDIVHEDGKQQKFYTAWANRIGLKNRVEHIARTYFKEGTVAISAKSGTISKKEEKALIAQGAVIKLKKGNLLVTEEVKARRIPIDYEIYNPSNLKKIGPPRFQTVLFKVDDILVKIVKKDKKDLTREEKIIIKNTPDKFIKEIRGQRKSRNVFVTLGLERDDPDLTMINYKKDDWQSWADPLIFAVLDDIKYKKLLRAADQEAARSIINALTIIKLGSTKDKLPPTKKEFEKLAQLLKTPTPTKTIIWNDLIEVVTAYPPIEKILGKGKYEAVDNDILAGFGVSEVLVNGKGGNYATSFLSVKTLLERLETCRCEIEAWLRKELRKIMKAMGWKEAPHIRFGRMNLRDEKAEKQILIDLMDRKVMSPETVLQYMGEKQAVETQRIKNEEEKRKDMEMDVRTPIKTDIDPNEDQAPEGRPPGDTSPQENDRETKPQGASLNPLMIMDMSSKAMKLYDQVEQVVCSKYCDNQDVTNKKSLVKLQREELDKIVFTVFSNLGVNYNVEDGQIIDLFSQANELMPDKRTSEIFESLKKQNNSVVTAQATREMRANALVMSTLEKE